MNSEATKKNTPNFILLGKIIISGTITLKTGMLIGGASDFSAIGTVDKVVIRDPLKREPIIPGSSLKGKLRHLLERRYFWGKKEEVVKMFSDLENEDSGNPKDQRDRKRIFNTKYSELMKNEPAVIKRLFGSNDREYATTARLQFVDSFINKKSIEQLERLDTDLYLTEVKFENTIHRLTGIANPRQFERVPAGTQFDFKIIYNIENTEEIKEDMKALRDAFETLEDDYLGSSGTRGYGQLSIDDLHLQLKSYDRLNTFKEFDDNTKREKFKEEMEAIISKTQEG